MAILRKANKGSFTVIDNTVFRDKELSNKALGLLCRMLSLPDGWNFSVMGLVSLSSDGKSAIINQLDELEDNGYLVRKQLRFEGKIAGVEYVVSETKMSEKPYADNQHAENQHAGNQHAENPPLSNTNISNTKESNNHKSNTKELSLSESPKIVREEFEKLWEMYPNKKGKDKALSYYEKAKKSGTTFEEVAEGIEAYIEYIKANNIEPRFVKHGATYFSNKSWQDVYEDVPLNSGNPFFDMLQKGDY